MTDIASTLESVTQRIDNAANAAGRTPKSVHLVTVSKTFPSDAIRAAYAAGSRDFGENYVQELTGKADELKDLHDLVWHFIGPLQSNKTRPVAETAHWVHSVERFKIAQRLSEQRPVEQLPLNICLQVNVSGESSKSGCSPDELPALANDVIQLPNLILRGLMCIPDPHATPDALRGQFTLLRKLLNQLNASGMKLDVLSMGMSADLDIAIEEGATHVRVGSAIFGQRHYPQ